MRNEKARAIVLNSRPLGEADRILRLFTRELGRVDAVVKGVRKTTSKWAAGWSPTTSVTSCSTRGARSTRSVSYTHLTLPTNREV